MKKMNVISVLSAFVILFSCSRQEQQIQEELEGVSAKTELDQEKDNYLFGLQIYHLIAVAEIVKLEKQKMELVVQIEEGNKKATEELESVQQSINKYEMLSENMLRIPRKFPRPPKGCINPEDKGCRIEIDLIQGIVLADGVELHKVEIKDSKNNVVGEGTKLGEDSLGQPVLLIKSDFKGSATMYFTIETKSVGKIILPLEVFNN